LFNKVNRFLLLTLFLLLLGWLPGHWQKHALALTAEIPQVKESPAQLIPDFLDTLSFPGLIKGPDSASCILPFTRQGNLILIKAQADTSQGNFILDTGAQKLVLNLTYFRHYPRDFSANALQTGATGVGGEASQTLINRFSLGTLDYPPMQADLVNLGHLENSKGIKILGLLGIALFKQCELIIDFEKSLIYLHRIGRKEAATYRHKQLTDTSAFNIVPIFMRDNRIVTRTIMAGKKLEFIIDCAAESNLLDSRLPNKIFQDVIITKRVMLLGTGNKKIEALAGNVKNMTIGNKTIGTLPVVITNLENTCFSYNGCINGILGFDFLSLNKVGFNFVKNQMYLWK
jgi:hypothetical protein